MRILLVTTAYPPPPGGIQTMTRNIEKSLQERGHNVRLLHLNPDDYRAVDSSIISDYIPRKKTVYGARGLVNGDYVYLNRVLRRARKEIQNFEPEIVHGMHIRTWPALIAANEKSTPSIVTTHSLELQNESLAASAFRDAGIVHCNSKFTEGLVHDIARRSGIASPNTTIIHPSIDLDAFEANLTGTKDVQEKQSGPVVTIARLVDRKNVKTVIEAWKLLPAEVRADRELIIVGEGENRTRLEELASSESDIRFTGWVSEQRKVELLERASVFVLPALRDGYDVEGFGIVYIEAQAAGTPVIGSSYGGVPEAVGDGGIIVDQPEDPVVVSDKIEGILTNEDEYENLLQNTSQRVWKFGNNRTIKGYLGLYNLQFQ